MNSIPVTHTPQQQPAWLPAAVCAAIAAVLAAAAGLLAGHLTGPATAPAPIATVAAAPYVAHELLVGYDPTLSDPLQTISREAGIRLTPADTPNDTPHELAVRLPAGVPVAVAAARVSGAGGVTYAVPNYIAHIAGSWIPNDPGRSGFPGGWQQLQWNFGAARGVNAPEAWENLRAVHRGGAKGVVIAVIDTGVAFKNWGKFAKSPDFQRTRFTAACDLVAGNLIHGVCMDRSPLDREGHGTFVASEIAEQTDNGIGLTGLAYGATIMPVRVLDSSGEGDSSTIATGIRYAVSHGAQVINLSMEFSLSITAKDIPGIMSAIRYAHNRGVVVVGAAGNDDANRIAFPARAPDVIAVGATTADRCLADYSNGGGQLALVAPGGGDDSGTVGGTNCQPTKNLPDVYQMTLKTASDRRSFGLPSGWFGTSMAAPAVSAAAAMVIASGVIGPDPTPDETLARLEQTAVPLGNGTPNSHYGYGLLDIGAATSPTTPPVTTTTPVSSTTTTPTPTAGTTPLPLPPPITNPSATHGKR